MHAHDRNDLFCPLDVLQSHIRQRHVANLALLLEARKSFHGVIEIDGWIGDVELVDVDAIEAQAFQAAFDGFLNMSRAALCCQMSGPWRTQPALVVMTRPAG